MGRTRWRVCGEQDGGYGERVLGKTRWRNLLTISTRSFLTSGSPPVKRTLLTPCEQNSLVSTSTSFAVSSCADGVRGVPASGIQY